MVKPNKETVRKSCMINKQEKSMCEEGPRKSLSRTKRQTEEHLLKAMLMFFFVIKVVVMIEWGPEG